MKVYIFFAALVAAVVIIECSHTFMGTNVLRQQVLHRDVKYSSRMFRKRVELFNFTMPASFGYGRSIQGILAYDRTNSDASANVTSGGLGFNYLTLRMKSDRGNDIHFDVYIYA
ncbi:jg1593 [Pararge aegeria aegeria]|uniref:Jg1593 protein n=1 Tax=Pararge aegeria aegeria TaxID=348720 RepID=A0A8S4S6Y5_9NEOP|nr:jg1593 [Pararge aegeria aegeria]